MNPSPEQEPIEYTLRSYPRFPRNWYYPKFRLATWHPIGVLTDEVADQIIEFTEIQERDEKQPFDRYTDFSGLTHLQLEINHVFEIARRRRAAAGAPVKSAILADQPISLSIAKMYERLMERAIITVRVFEDRKAAAEWLGVPLKILYPPGEQKRKPIA